MGCLLCQIVDQSDGPDGRPGGRVPPPLRWVDFQQVMVVGFWTETMNSHLTLQRCHHSASRILAMDALEAWCPSTSTTMTHGTKCTRMDTRTIRRRRSCTYRIPDPLQRRCYWMELCKMGRSQVKVADDFPSLSKRGEANYVDASPSTTRERMEIQHGCSMTVSSPKWTH